MNDQLRREKGQVKIIQQKAQSLLIPSSFQLNPQYFNHRLVRIKKKIDQLIKQLIPSQNQFTSHQSIAKSITGNNRNSNQTAQTNQANKIQIRQVIAVDQIQGETKNQIQSVYNEIHLLESVAVKDQYAVQTNTVQLRSFLKDLRKLNKRLSRKIPQSVLFEMEKDKQRPFKRSILDVSHVHSQSLITQTRLSQQQQLLLANKMIEAQLYRKTYKKNSQKYYDDLKHQGTRCNLLSCQIM